MFACELLLFDKYLHTSRKMAVRAEGFYLTVVAGAQARGLEFAIARLLLDGADKLMALVRVEPSVAARIQLRAQRLLQLRAPRV